MMPAGVHTLTIVEAACQADAGVADTVRRRILEILRSGVTAPAGSPMLSEREAAAVLDMACSTLNRWRRGQRPEDGPFPFTTCVNSMGRLRYDRAEVVAYHQARMLRTLRRPAPATPNQE
jgi:hypothetical protein